MNNILRPMKVIAFLLLATALACSKPEMIEEQPSVQPGPDVTLEVTLMFPLRRLWAKRPGIIILSYGPRETVYLSMGEVHLP